MWNKISEIPPQPVMELRRTVIQLQINTGSQQANFYI